MLAAGGSSASDLEAAELALGAARADLEALAAEQAGARSRELIEAELAALRGELEQLEARELRRDALAAKVAQLSGHRNVLRLHEVLVRKRFNHHKNGRNFIQISYQKVMLQ